jgi:hypothetical protein
MALSQFVRNARENLALEGSEKNSKKGLDFLFESWYNRHGGRKSHREDLPYIMNFYERTRKS